MTEFYVLGCRSPNSKGPGCWDGAFVFAIDKSTNNRIIGLFDNFRDYIRDNPNISYAVGEYESRIQKGWLPMSLEDIAKTAGVKGTLFDIEKYQNYYPNTDIITSVVIGLVTGSVIFLWLVFS